VCKRQEKRRNTTESVRLNQSPPLIVVRVAQEAVKFRMPGPHDIGELAVTDEQSLAGLVASDCGVAGSSIGTLDL